MKFSLVALFACKKPKKTTFGKMWIANNKLLVAAFTVSAAPVPAPVDADLVEGAVVRRIIL